MVRHTETALIIEVPSTEPAETQAILMSAITHATSLITEHFSSGGGDEMHSDTSYITSLMELLNAMFPNWAQLKQIHKPKGKAAA